MATSDLHTEMRSDDPAVGLRAVGVLHRLAEQVEATHVRLARERGWSWDQIGDALGVSRQSVHAKYRKRGR
jgi:Homeodomain-like domain-containing protein